MYTFLICLALVCQVTYGQGSCSASNPEKAKEQFSNADLKEFGDDCNKLASAPNAKSLCLENNEGKTLCPCTCKKVEEGNYQGGGGGGGNGDGGNGDDDKTTKPSETTAATTAAPSDSSGGGGECFHGESQVQTDQGPMSMMQLSQQKNIKVQAVDSNGNIVMSPLRMWGHADSAKTSDDYIKFTTESGHAMELTSNHLIYTSNCQRKSRVAKFASDVYQGQCLLVQQGNELVASKVVSIEKNTRLGLYAPITQEGSIIVDNVAASCYASFSGEYIAHKIVSTLYSIWDMLPAQLTQGSFPPVIQCLIESADKLSLY